MVFTRILQKVLRAQAQILAGIFCDEEGEMVVMAMQHEQEPEIDAFEFKVLAAQAAVWVRTISRIQVSEKNFPDMNMRFRHYQVHVQALPRDHYLMFVALPRAPSAQLRRLAQGAGQACMNEI